MMSEWHPYADVFPWIEGDAFADLKADIEKHGVLEPVVFFEGKVLDGRNRYKAATELGIKFPTTEYRGSDPLGFVISHNLKRRHLTESQRAMVAAKLATMAHGGDRKSDQAENLPLVSQEQAAKQLNVSDRSIRTAKTVHDHGAPELVSAVESGKVSVSAAAVIAKQDHDTQKRIVAEDNLKRAAADLREAEKQAKEAEALPKPEPLSPEQKAEQQRVFGTEQERAIFLEVNRITEAVVGFPNPAEAAAKIPPAFDHAVDIQALREVARWFDAFANAYQDKEASRVAAE